MQDMTQVEAFASQALGVMFPADRLAAFNDTGDIK